MLNTPATFNWIILTIPFSLESQKNTHFIFKGALNCLLILHRKMWPFSWTSCILTPRGVDEASLKDFSYNAFVEMLY